MAYNSNRGVVEVDGEPIGVAESVSFDLHASDSVVEVTTAECDVCGKECPVATMNYVGSTVEEHAGVFCSDEHTPHKHAFGRYR